MSGSCIYCCAYTSEVLCTVLVSHLYSDVVGVSVSWVHYPCNVYTHEGYTLSAPPPAWV